MAQSGDRTEQELPFRLSTFSRSDARPKAETKYQQYRQFIDCQPRHADADFDQAFREIPKSSRLKEPGQQLQQPIGGWISDFRQAGVCPAQIGPAASTEATRVVIWYHFGRRRPLCPAELKNQDRSMRRKPSKLTAVPSRYGRGPERAWKESQGKDSLHEMAFGEPVE